MTSQQTPHNSIEINWLSNIPQHWKILKLRSILKHVSTKNRPNLPLLSITRERGIILRDVSSKEENHNYIPDDLTNYKVVSPGQFGINKMKAWQGSYGVSMHHGIISPAYYTFNLTGVTCDFFHLAIRSKVYIPFFAQASDGVRVGQWDLSLTRMKEIPFFIPPEEEQRKIVKVISLVNLKINKFIQKKKRLIELLKEQKQVIINQAVTCGLDPNVRLKPSGVEWLGDIPEHWEISRIRNLATVRASGVDKHTVVGETTVRLCNYVDVYKNDEITDQLDFMQASATPGEIANFKLLEDDIIITKDSEDWRDIGVPSYVPRNVNNLICGYHLSLIRPDNDLINGRFLYTALLSDPVADQFRISATGVTRFGLSQGSIKSTLLPLPPIAEQKAISEYVKSKNDSIKQLISRIQKEIDLIQEYRTRLISDVVTGQIDVRNIEVGDIIEKEIIEEAFEEEQEEESLELVGARDDD